ncbi:MAG: TonB-dependent receptor [Bacteroidales bacterium]
MKNKLILFLWLISAYAHAIKVTGTVYDERKEPIIGASVQVKGVAGLGTATDFDGNFTLEIEDIKDGSLVVSYIGYKTKYIPLKGRTIITAELEPNVSELDEVVVVGYGAVRKSDLTGSVTSVKASDEEAARATSFDKMLQGKAAGVMISTGSSAPGGSVSVRIRGTSSLRGNNSPLYVIDGNIISSLGETSNPMSQGTSGGNSRIDEQNPLAAISPQDIESIEILKDASATAIYGSQGANGVILITTKQGKTGKPAIAVSANVTLSKLAREIDMLNAYEYLEFRNNPVFLGEGTPVTMDGYTPVNWQKESTQLAVSQNYRASMSGKSNKTAYYLATGYSDMEGVIRKTGVNKFDIRLNLDQEINDYIKLKSNTSFSSINTSMTSGTDKLANTRTSIVRHMISFKPLKGMNDDYSEYDENVTSPETWFTDYDDDSEENLFNTNLAIDIKANKWLSFRVKGGLIQKTKERNMWFGKLTSIGAQTNGKAGIANLKTRSYNTEALALFNHRFNSKHNINGTVGITYDKKNVLQSSMTGEDFFTEDLRADGISQAAKQYPYLYTKVGEQLFSVLARAVYNYGDRYVVTATFRADGSSKFDKSNRFSYFPSFAGAWRINQESWMRDVKQISNLKLRLGWGQVGNQAVSPYQTMDSYNTVGNAKPDGSLEPGIVPARIANPDLKWETSEQYNAGIDLGLFNQRLNLTFDAYIKETKDLLQQIALPTASGYSSMWINNGKIQNKGIEIAIDAYPYSTKNWSWNVGGNISFSQNTIKELGMAPANFGMLHNQRGYWGENVGNNTFTKFPANVFLVGRSIGLFMGYQTNGILQEEEYNSAAYQAKPLVMNGTTLQAGDIRYVDQNGDGVINNEDRVVLGNPNPDFAYALNTSVRYKNWTLDMAFNGVHGNEIINANLIDETDVKNANNNIRRDAFYGAWTPENKSNAYPRFGYTPQGVLSDRYIEDGSYFKMAHISVSYLLKFKKTKAIQSMTFNATATNLFTITSYSGYDPDVNTFANDVDRMGIDLVSYPAARNFTFGIIANF